jgi:phage-related protein
MHSGADSDWTIEYYIDDRGRSPVEEFLDSLDLKAGTRFIWLIERLRVLNVAAREPLVKKLDDKLWELRAESRTNIFRVCYCYVSGRRIILLHGFQKKTQRTPRGEIEIAQRRLARFLARESGEDHGRRCNSGPRE